jgi:ATP-dependent DNA helicase RecQ
MSILRQMIQHGLLIQDMENYGILKLTPATRAILRDGERISLAKPRIKIEKKKSKKGLRDDYPDVDEDVFNRLRTLRRQLADKEQVPAYIVCGDETLRQMAILKPKTREDLLHVPGIGERKADRFGEAFLELLRDL